MTTPPPFELPPPDVRFGAALDSLARYSGAAVRQCIAERDAWLPARVMLTSAVRGDGPFSRSHAAEPNVYTADCNRWGAVAVRSRSDGPLLGLKPAEFEVVTWRANEKEQT